MTNEVEPLWGIVEVAAYLKIPERTLYQWRHRGYGPPGRRVGGRRTGTRPGRGLARYVGGDRHAQPDPGTGRRAPA